MTVNLKNPLRKLKTYWNNIHRSVQPYLNCDCNRCLDLIMIGGGIQPLAGTEPWKRNCLTLYRLLGFYQCIIALARVGFSVQSPVDSVEISASIMMATAVVTGYVKLYTLKKYGEVVRQSKAFISSNLGHSGDPDYDASVRRDGARVTGKVILIIFLILCFDQMAISVPNYARDLVFGIPKQFHTLRFVDARLLQETFVFMIAVRLGCRYLCCSLTILPILMGLRSELIIVARGYNTIEERVQALVLEDQKTAVGSSQKLQANVLRWKHLKQILGTTLEQHVEVQRNIQLVQPFMSLVYAFIYYGAMMFVSIIVLLTIKGGVTLVCLRMAVTGSYFIMECYFWSRLIESIQENMENIADSTAQLGFRLKHSLENNSEYRQMRMSLMIIQLHSSQRELFSCGGIFPISVESFGNLCMIIYRFVTFLLSFE